MADYTPTTDEVRDSFMHDDLTGTPDELIAEAFDRWYEAEIRAAKAEAWDEGATEATDQDVLRPTNPYREKED